jgi:hypothetical protein
MADSRIPAGGTGEDVQTFKNTVAGEEVHSEAVTLVDQFGVPIATVGASVATLETAGAGGYHSGELATGTPSATLTGRLLSLRVYVTGGADASLQIDAGDTITVRDGVGFDWSPRSDWDDAELTWVSGTMDYFAEVAT